jgi:hypothetical protein
LTCYAQENGFPIISSNLFLETNFPGSYANDVSQGKNLVLGRQQEAAVAADYGALVSTAAMVGSALNALQGGTPHLHSAGSLPE